MGEGQFQCFLGGGSCVCSGGGGREKGNLLECSFLGGGVVSVYFMYGGITRHVLK